MGLLGSVSAKSWNGWRRSDQPSVIPGWLGGGGGHGLNWPSHSHTPPGPGPPTRRLSPCQKLHHPGLPALGRCKPTFFSAMEAGFGLCEPGPLCTDSADSKGAVDRLDGKFTGSVQETCTDPSEGLGWVATPFLGLCFSHFVPPFLQGVEGTVYDSFSLFVLTTTLCGR